MSLTIAVSTISKRIYDIRDSFFDIRFNYLILWQDSLPELPYFIDKINVTLVRCDSVGVTQSRNLALKLCVDNWIWFMDDDVYIPSESYDNLYNSLSNLKTNTIYIAKVCYFNSERCKKFSRRFLKKFSILNVGTIQIICNPKIARKFNCYFPKNMGAGSLYPLCDEPIFLSRLLRFAYSDITDISNVKVYHDLKSSGQNVETPASLISRAILFREVFGFPLCFLFSLFFFIKFYKKIGKNFMYLLCYYKAS